MLQPHKPLLLFALSLLMAVSSCQVREESKAVTGELLTVDSMSVPLVDPSTDSIIEGYRGILEEEMNQVIAHSAQLMRKGTPEDLLNNFVADLVLEKGQMLYEPEDGAPIDFCVLNYGGLRTSIPQGPVTRSRIFEVMPFENEMVVLTLSPEKTREVFQYIASRNVGTPIAGLVVGVRNGQPEEVSIQGAPFNPDRPYKVLTTDYLAGSGDNMSFFENPMNTEIVGMRVRDAILLHLAEHQARDESISSSLDGRIYYRE